MRASVFFRATRPKHIEWRLARFNLRVGMSGNHREHVMSRSEQAPRALALGDGLACESPVSPIPIALALGRAAAGRAAMHPATPFSSDHGRAAWPAGSGSGAAFAAHGVVSHFSLPPGWFTAPMPLKSSSVFFPPHGFHRGLSLRPSRPAAAAPGHWRALSQMRPSCV
jgi:hypothetical protein